jgi:hypothetical protein
VSLRHNCTQPTNQRDTSIEILEQRSPAPVFLHFPIELSEDDLGQALRTAFVMTNVECEIVKQRFVLYHEIVHGLVAAQAEG